MEKYILILFFVLSSMGCVAQNKAGDRWLLGFCFGCDIPNPENFGGVYLNFEEGEEPTVEKVNITSDFASMVTNDTDGNLLFYSTGCNIFNKNHLVMDNGGGISPGLGCMSEFRGLHLTAGTISIPTPEQTSNYLYFHLNVEPTPEGGQILKNMLLTTIDMAANQGLGRVESKNNLLIADSLVDAMSATRHANGRDWWVVVPRGPNRQFWTLLITPEGVASTQMQTVPPPYRPFKGTVKLESPNPPYFIEVPAPEYGRESQAGQLNFSPDGNFICRVSPYGEFVDLFRFNRCSGEFKLLRSFDLKNDSPYGGDDVTSVAGTAFSPNSRVLYFNNGYGVYQFSLRPEGMENREPVLIELFDGFAESNSNADFGKCGRVRTAGSISVLRVVDFYIILRNPIS